MPCRYLLAVMLAAIGLCASLPAHAAFVVPAQVRVAGVAELPSAMPVLTLTPALVAGEALCVDRSLCQPWTEIVDTGWAASSAPGMVNPTLIANLALVALGLLWFILTRRSLRVARKRAR